MNLVFRRREGPQKAVQECPELRGISEFEGGFAHKLAHKLASITWLIVLAHGYFG